MWMHQGNIRREHPYARACMIAPSHRIRNSSTRSSLPSSTFLSKLAGGAGISVVMDGSRLPAYALVYILLARWGHFFLHLIWFNGAFILDISKWRWSQSMAFKWPRLRTVCPCGQSRSRPSEGPRYVFGDDLNPAIWWGWAIEMEMGMRMIWSHSCGLLWTFHSSATLRLVLIFAA